MRRFEWEPFQGVWASWRYEQSWGWYACVLDMVCNRVETLLAPVVERKHCSERVIHVSLQT